MATTNDWAAFLSGSYQGWMRSPGDEWGDLIGRVKIQCVANAQGSLDVTISTLEFGMWTGQMHLEDMVVEGPTGQGDTFFRCAFEERGTAEEAQGVFAGGIYEPLGKPVFELRLSSEWRRLRPE